MFCPNCGSNNTDEAKFCTGCGAPLNANKPENEVKNNNVANNPTSILQPETQPEVVVQKKFSGKAIASFVVSLVGIFIAAIVCGIIGLVLSRVATQDINTKGNLKGKGLAVAGMVISIIDIAAWVVYLLI